MLLDLNRVCPVCGKRRGGAGHTLCSKKMQRDLVPAKAAKKVSYKTKSALKFWDTFN